MKRPTRPLSIHGMGGKNQVATAAITRFHHRVRDGVSHDEYIAALNEVWRHLPAPEDGMTLFPSHGSIPVWRIGPDGRGAWVWEDVEDESVWEEDDS